MAEDTDLMAEVELEVADLTDAELEDEAKKIFSAQEKRKQYRQNTEKSPEQLEAQKTYRKKRYAREKAILARAKELGIEPESE